MDISMDTSLHIQEQPAGLLAAGTRPKGGQQPVPGLGSQTGTHTHATLRLVLVSCRIAAQSAAFRGSQLPNAATCTADLLGSGIRALWKWTAKPAAGRCRSRRKRTRKRVGGGGEKARKARAAGRLEPAGGTRTRAMNTGRSRGDGRGRNGMANTITEQTTTKTTT